MTHRHKRHPGRWLYDNGLTIVCALFLLLAAGGCLWLVDNYGEVFRYE